MQGPVDPILTTVLTVIGEKLLAELAGRAAGAMGRSRIDAAITATQQKYPNVIVEEALSAWTRSDDFRELLQRFVAGERDFGHKDFVESFVLVGGFSLPSQTELYSTAEDILATFLAEVQVLLYASNEGNVAIAARQEVLHDRTHSGIRDLATAVETLAAEVNVSLDDQRSRSGQQVLHAQIDRARELLTQGKLDSAQIVLKQIRDALPSDADVDVRFRLETNLGFAAAELGDDVGARRYLGSALQLKPLDPTALANAAQAELAASNTARALDLARRAWDAEKNAHTATSLILTLRASGRRDEVRVLVGSETWMQIDPLCLAVLGQSSLEDGEIAEAIRLFRESLALDPAVPRVWMQLASALVRHVQEALLLDVPVSWRMSDQLRRELEEAEALLATASASLKTREPRAAHLDALAFRASVLLMLDRPDEAVEECDYVLHEAPTHIVAMRTKGVAVAAKNPSLAADLLEVAWGLTTDDPMVGIALANAYGSSGRLADGEVLLRVMRDPRSRDRLQINVLMGLADILRRAGKDAEVRATEAELLADWPEDPEAILGAARIRRSRGDQEGALELLRPSLEAAPAGMAAQIALELADLLMERRDYLDASHALDGVVDDKAPLWLRQRYAACLFNAGRLKDALAFAKRQRGDGPPLAGISEVEAEVLLRVSDLAAARGLLEALANQEGERADLWMKCAQIAWQQRELASARGFLRRLAPGDFAADPVGLMMLAQLRRELNEPDALPAAYQARRLAFDQPRMHLAYMAVFLGREEADEALFRVNQVDAGCTVLLERDSETQVWTIEDDKPDGGRGEIPSAGSLAQRLIGHVAGDVVVLKEGGLEDLRYQIKEVKSKYVQAFQDTIQNFSSRFPDEHGFDRVQIRNDDITPLLRMLDERSERAAQVLELYAKRLLPLATVAQLLGVPLIEAARDLREWSTQTVLVSSGGPGDADRERRSATTEVVVVDPTALLTIDELGLWDVLPGLFKRVLVPQPIIDELGEALREPVGRQSGTAAKVGEQYVMRDVDQHELDERRARQERLLARVRTELEVVPATGILDIEVRDVTRSVEMLGTGSFAALHVARVEGAVLWSDDLGLRGLAANDYGVDGTWTQPVLQRAVGDSAIPQERYQGALFRMAEWRFLAVRITGEELAAILGRQGGVLTSAAGHVVGFVLGADFDQTYAISLAAEAIRGVWLQRMLLPRKQLILDLMLSSLVRGRNATWVLGQLRARLSRRLQLVPQAEAEVLRSIDLWIAVRRLPSQASL